jgi:hypothetical protein
MNPRFKPLITPAAPAAAESRPFNLKIASAESTAAAFKPLSSVLPAGTPGNGGRRAGNAPEDQVEPALELKREGDRITRISVTCGCGCRHEIECEY